MTASLTYLNLSSDGATSCLSHGDCGLVSLTDVYSFGDNISNVCNLSVPLDVLRIAANKSIRSCAVIMTQMTDNCSAWTRSMMSKARLSADTSCIRINNVISYRSMLGVVGVSDRDAVTYSLDNSFEGWSVLGSHVINILRDMAMYIQKK